MRGRSLIERDQNRSMIDNFNAILERNFDRYARNAQLKPGLLIVVPAVVTLIAFVPGALDVAKALGAVVVTVGATFALAQLARSRGRRLEPKLYQLWRGMPSVTWLRHRDQRLDAYTKKRYHDFLATTIRGWVAPTPESEAADPSKADDAYASASRWLRENTRDAQKYPRIADENISYGFRRNSLGSRSYGATVAAISAVVAAALMAMFKLYFGWPVSAFQILSFALDLVFVWYWLIVVTPDWVRDAADAYARAVSGLRSDDHTERSGFNQNSYGLTHLPTR
jgi:hypothetical protein